MTDKEQIIIDGIILNDVKDLLFTGQRSSITTSTFEKIIDFLAQKTRECEELKKYIQEREVWGDHCEFCKHNDKENCHQNIILDNLKTINSYRKALEEIQTLTGKIISNDDQPACVMDTECPLNGGVGFDNHCNENCPLISAKQILNIINKAKER